LKVNSLKLLLPFRIRHVVIDKVGDRRGDRPVAESLGLAATL